jgi:hypothetical protein
MGLARKLSIGGLARAFSDEGRLAELEGRTADAVRCHVDTIRLGQAAESGGLIMDWALGSAVEGIGLGGLYRMHRSLTPAQSRRLIAELRRVDAGREPFEKAMARELSWMERQFGWQVRLNYVGSKIGCPEAARPYRMEHGLQKGSALMRLVICELAIHVYTAENGTDPEELADLVPDYLASVPEDPFSGGPPVYRRTSTGHLLYSVGWNQRDDGGGTPRADEPMRDIVLEDYFRHLD